MKFNKFGAIILALILLACAEPCARAGQKPVRRSGSAPNARQAQRDFAPLVDHHQHLLSPAGAESKLPSVELPAPLSQFLHERELSWNDATRLEQLFGEDAALFTGWKWINGGKAIAGYLAKGFTGPYRLKPVSYKIDDRAGQISGYMVEGDATNVHFAFFHLDLANAGNGKWRIRSETEVFPGPAMDNPVTAEQLIKALDEAGIRRAVVLSDAYYFGAGKPSPVPDEYNKVRAENDWTAAQVAKFPNRLVAFCSFNPVRTYALQEMTRCASSGRFKGLKLHFNAAQLKFHDSEEVNKVRRVMEAANKYRMPIIIHVRPGDEYGRSEAEIFLHQVVAAAPDVPIQIAHLWGGESFSGPALAVYAEAVAAGDPVTKNLYFDISGAWVYGKPEQMAEITARMRQIGMARILYASDGPPSASWKEFRTKLPLTTQEFRAIANNVAPYMQTQN